MEEQQPVDVDLVIGATLRRIAAWWHVWCGDLKRAVERDIAAGRPGWRILRYQRIIEPSEWLYPLPRTLYTTPRTFATQIKYLAENFNVLPVTEIVNAYIHGKPIEPMTVAVTFDGGYEDLYRNAAPIIARCKIPATAFIPTAFVDTLAMFWDARIEASLITLARAGEGFPQFEVLPDEYWSWVDTIGIERTELSLKHIATFVEYLRASPSELRLSVQVALDGLLAPYRGLEVQRTFLSWDEIRRLAKEGFTFGINGHTHAAYTELPPEIWPLDLGAALSNLNQQGLTPNNILALPAGGIPDGGRAKFMEYRMPYLLADNPIDPSSPEPGRATIIGRTISMKASQTMEIYLAVECSHERSGGLTLSRD